MRTGKGHAIAFIVFACLLSACGESSVDAYTRGHDAGYEAGYDEGHADGYEEGRRGVIDCVESEDGSADEAASNCAWYSTRTRQ